MNPASLLGVADRRAAMGKKEAHTQGKMGRAPAISFSLAPHVPAAPDFEGKTTTYAYDHVGRRIQETYPGSLGSVTYAYDSARNLSTVTDALSHVTDYDYDSNQRLTAVNFHHGKTTKYFYDTYGRMTKVGAGSLGTTDPTEYFYSGTTGLLTKVGYTSGANTVYANYAYAALDRLTKLTEQRR